MRGARSLWGWPLLGVLLSGGLLSSAARADPSTVVESDAGADYDLARARSTASALTAAVTSALGDKPDAVVLSQDDVRRMLSLEAERAVMGCDDEASCLAESPMRSAPGSSSPAA
jgi:hypothetical protein